MGTTVLRLSATDGDNDIVTFSKVDVSDVQGGNFFVVSNGDIVLVNALSGQASYTVSLWRSACILFSLFFDISTI